MSSIRLRGWLGRVLIAATAMAAPLAAGSSASAATPDPLGGFQFSQPVYSVEENAGTATVTVTRPAAESLFGAEVRYITTGNGYDPSLNGPYQCLGGPCSAMSPTDFTSGRGDLQFTPGQTDATFQVPIVNHNVDTSPKTIQLSLFGAFGYPPGRQDLPIGLGNLAHAVLVINNDIPVLPAQPGNPLGGASPVAGNPLAGATFFVDPQDDPAVAAKQNPQLNVIARQPGTARFGTFSFTSPYVGDIATAASRYLARAQQQQPGSTALLSTYRIVAGQCSRPAGQRQDTPAEVQSYENFANGLAQGIGSYKAVLFLEQDSLITTPCLTPTGLTERMSELKYAISVLSKDPHLVIYLDAGAADALPASRAAQLLNLAGVSQIQGFFLNATHFDWTKNEIAYGEKVSRLTGGKHFVINTGENGRGPQVPRDRVHQGNEVLCNPTGMGLGPLPSTHTGFANVDAFEWTSNPGESGGHCGAGAPPTGAYWPAYALGLVKRANFKVQ